MCGIVGYIGKRQAAPILLQSLAQLEYRGYDSAGIAVKGEEITIYKSEGQLASLFSKINGGKEISGNIGIGHTRWATHGIVNTINAHPHSSDCENNVVVVHNGIIENYLPLKQRLYNSGYEFYSETDSEVIAKLIDFYLNLEGNPIKAIARFIDDAHGSYAIAILFKKYGDAIYAVRKDSSMIVGVNEDGAYIASDLQAILPYTHDVFFLQDKEIAKIEASDIHFYNKTSKEITKEKTHIELDAQVTDKGDYEHFMLKEIFEQPKVLRDTYNSIIDEVEQVFAKIRKKIQTFQNLSYIQIVACGSAYNVGLILRNVLEKICNISVDVELASEYRYKAINQIQANSLIIVISQSGETADSIAAMRKAKKLGHDTLAIVNVLGSTIDLEADNVLHTKAGAEIAVATTKAYSAQLIAGYIFCIRLALERKTILISEYQKYLEEVGSIPEKVDMVLKYKESIRDLAFSGLRKHNVFLVGRDMDYHICKEGALKLKEVSYLFAEAYAAGEFKHGAISLIDKEMLVIGLLTQSHISSKLVSNLFEIKSRGAQMLLIVKEDLVQYLQQLNTNMMLILPNTNELFMASLACVPLQMLAYYIGVVKGNEIDKPRNLAKCVTVE